MLNESSKVRVPPIPRGGDSPAISRVTQSNRASLCAGPTARDYFNVVFSVFSGEMLESSVCPSNGKRGTKHRVTEPKQAEKDLRAYVEHLRVLVVAQVR